VYGSFTACLLTDDRGVGGTAAAPVWAGMQDASLATRAKVQYLAVVGAATRDNARAYLSGLEQRHCDVIVAVGGAQVDAVYADAPRVPAQRFVVVGGGAGAASNVTVVTATGATELRDAVRRVIVAAVAGAAHS
jgi:basic membrane lipoprotein Med (substrate-binding protein (PBP1-ABC) superfamily)